MSVAAERVHATAVAFGTKGVLIRGPSGSGKSDLALRCLSFPCGQPAYPRLVADDQVMLTRTASGVVACAPDILRGKLEVRGVGIIDCAAVEQAAIILVADIAREGSIDRLPDPWPTVEILTFRIPLIRIYAFEASAPAKIAAALATAALPPVQPNH